MSSLAELRKEMHRKYLEKQQQQEQQEQQVVQQIAQPIQPPTPPQNFNLTPNDQVQSVPLINPEVNLNNPNTIDNPNNPDFNNDDVQMQNRNEENADFEYEAEDFISDEELGGAYEDQMNDENFHIRNARNELEREIRDGEDRENDEMNARRDDVNNNDEENEEEEEAEHGQGVQGGNPHIQPFPFNPNMGGFPRFNPNPIGEVMWRGFGGAWGGGRQGGGVRRGPVRIIAGGNAVDPGRGHRLGAANEDQFALWQNRRANENPNQNRNPAPVNPDRSRISEAILNRLNNPRSANEPVSNPHKVVRGPYHAKPLKDLLLSFICTNLGLFWHSISLLPADILQKIISTMLKSKQLDKKMMHHFGGMRIYELNLNNYDAVTNEFLEAVASNPKLSSVSIGGCFHYTDNGIQYLQSLPLLTYLNLSGGRVTDTGVRYLKVLTNLTELNLKGTKITDKGTVHLMSLTNLTSLNISQTTITDNTLTSICNLPLTALSLAATNITSQGTLPLSVFSMMTNLDLSNCLNLTNVTMTHISQLFELRMLDLAGCLKITPTGLYHLQELKNISILKYTNKNLDNDSLKYISSLELLSELDLADFVKISDISCLKKMVHLNTLSLAHTSITNDSLGAIVPLQGLHTVDLSRTLIGDEGVYILFSMNALQNCTFLSLSQTRITHVALHYIVEGFSSLTTLNVSANNGIGNDGIPDIMNLVKKLLIFDIRGIGLDADGYDDLAKALSCIEKKCNLRV